MIRHPIVRPILSVIAAIAASLTVASGLIVLSGANPLAAFSVLLYGAFGTPHNLTETLVKAAPLLLTGLGVSVAFRARFWNIGEEGQLYLGALTATWIGLNVNFLQPVVLMAAILFLSFLAGGVWCIIPGILKSRFGINEIITTLMMNYIAVLLVAYMVGGPMRDPAAGGFHLSPLLPESAQLPILAPGTRLHAGFLIGVAATFAVYALLWHTALGYDVRAVGINPEAARCSGTNVTNSLLTAALVSGGLGGLAGLGEVSGIQGRLLETLSPFPGYGYVGIIVALLGKLHPVGVILAAIFLGGLIVGADTMTYATGVSVFIAFVIQALVVLFVISFERLGIFRRRR